MSQQTDIPRCNVLSTYLGIRTCLATDGHIWNNSTGLPGATEASLIYMNMFFPPESYYEHAEILRLIIDSKTATNARTERVQLRPKDARERQLIFTSEKL